MQCNSPIDPIDYLVIGHITQDLTPQGPKLGGTVSFAALTAKAMGLRVGIVTAINPNVPLDHLEGIHVVNIPSEESTTFNNIITPQGRIQYVYHVAPQLDAVHIPELWRSTPIVHLGPIAQEVQPTLVKQFPNSFIGLTPQGWLREWDASGRVRRGDWPEYVYVLENADAAVLSIEDIGGNEAIVDEMAASIRTLVITEGAAGARVFWNGEMRRFTPPQVVEVDPTGAGDIFATAFFVRFHHTHDAWDAAQFATQLAALSVTRIGLESAPTPQEVETFSVPFISY